MILQDKIVNYTTPFIISISGEKSDDTKVELLVKIGGRYHVGYMIHDVTIDVYQDRPELLQYTIDCEEHVLDMNNIRIPAILLVKSPNEKM